MAQARPDKIKAIVAVEPAVAGDKAKAGEAQKHPDAGDLRRQIPHHALAENASVGLDYAEPMRAAGGKVDMVDLPDIGIKGNSHMMMMDRNNAQIADLIRNGWSARAWSNDAERRLMPNLTRDNIANALI